LGWGGLVISELSFSICQKCKSVIIIRELQWEKCCPKCGSKDIIYNVDKDNLVINSISASTTADIWETNLSSITKTEQNYNNILIFQKLKSNKTVSKINIKRNQYIDSRYILLNTKLKVGDFFNVEKIKEDIKSIFDLGYFTKVWVDTSPKGSSIDISFLVEENPIIKNINIKVDSKISPFFIKQNMLLSPGKMMNWKIFQDDLNLIHKIYSNLGFLCTSIEDTNFEDGELSFSLNLATIEKLNTNNIAIKDQLEKLNFSLPRLFDYYELKEFLLKIYSDYKMQIMHFTLNPGKNKDSLIIDLILK
jgi:outer membrane protein assembly factor BamA